MANGKKKTIAKTKADKGKFGDLRPTNKRKYADTPAGKLKKKRDEIRKKSSAAYKARGGKTNVQGGRTYTRGAKPKKK